MPLPDLWLTVLLTITSSALPPNWVPLKMPPPPELAELSLRVLFATTNVALPPAEPSLKMPPARVAELPTTVSLRTVSVALPGSSPSLKMPPPLTALLPLIVQLVTVSSDLLFQMPPPTAPAALPLAIVRLAITTLEACRTWNTRLAWLPLTASMLAPGPRIVTPFVMSNSPLVNTIVPVTLGQKVIASPSLALATAARKEPGPLSNVFCTRLVHTASAQAWYATARHNTRYAAALTVTCPCLLLILAWVQAAGTARSVGLD